jgi:spore maturation protein SpmB
VLVTRWKIFKGKYITKFSTFLLLIVFLMIGVSSALNIYLKVKNYESIAVEILSVSGLLNILAEFFKPVMSILGLPGEASLVIILGYFLGTYAGLGALAAIDLNGIQITTIAIMLSISHSLISESAIVKKLGVSAGASIAVRVSFSILAGFLHYRIFG